MCTDRHALIDTEIVLLKIQNIFHKINYPEEYSTSNDISYESIIFLNNVTI